MNNRYKIRMYESGDGESSVAAGAIVLPIDRGFSMEASSLDEVERRIRDSVKAGKLPAGRIYRICPAIENPEFIQAVAVDLDGNAKKVHLDEAKGIYSEFRQLRYRETAERAAVEA